MPQMSPIAQELLAFLYVKSEALSEVGKEVGLKPPIAIIPKNQLTMMYDSSSSLHNAYLDAFNALEESKFIVTHPDLPDDWKKQPWNELLKPMKEPAKFRRPSKAEEYRKEVVDKFGKMAGYYDKKTKWVSLTKKGFTIGCWLSTYREMKNKSNSRELIEALENQITSKKSKPSIEEIGLARMFLELIAENEIEKAKK